MSGIPATGLGCRARASRRHLAIRRHRRQCGGEFRRCALPQIRIHTDMTTDPFSLMRGAFCLQRALANDLAFPESNPGGLPVPQAVTSRQVIEMATIAGAASNRILDKVGT